MVRYGLRDIAVAVAVSAVLAACSTTRVDESSKTSAKKATADKTAAAVKAVPAAEAKSLPIVELSARSGKFWIVRPDGSKSCGVKKGVTPREAARELEAEGVKIIRQRIGHDGQMRMMVCGADTGNLVEMLIDGQGLPAASKKGFRIKGED